MSSVTRTWSVYVQWADGRGGQEYEQETVVEAVAIVQERGNDSGQGMC